MILVNGHETKSIVDPGSTCTLVRKSFAEKVGKCEEYNTKLHGFAGGEYVCSGKVRVPLVIDNNKIISDLLIIDDYLIKENVLLGKDVLCRADKRLVIEGDKCTIERIQLINACADLNDNERKLFDKLINNYGDVFANNISEIGKCAIAKMSIKVNTDVPICLKPYRVPFAKRPIIAKIISELLENDIIRPSESPYSSPVVLVDKKSGDHRLCIDYRCLNKITIKQPFPMPNMEEQFAQLAGNTYFTTLDLRMGYHQIEIEETSKKFTAFVTTEGHYEFNRMPFGLVNAPAVFQCVMNNIVSKMPPNEVLVYLDDVIIPSKTVEEGLNRLRKFFMLLREANLTLRVDKCKFLQKKIEHLGHVINENGITPGKTKINAILNFPKPKNITEVRRFLGLTGFFRKFVANYSLIAKPLTQLLHKENIDNFVWGENQQNAFTRLINTLAAEPILALYDPNSQHEVHTDASSVGLAGVLLQSSDGKNWKPVFYYSRHCTASESKCHSYELEVLAVVETLERFRIYLLGKRFRVVTDCSAIAHVKENKELKPKIARWWLKLLEYDFECTHRPGLRLQHVDALSRMPNEPSREIEPAGLVLKVTANVDDWLLTMQLQDEKLQNIIAILNGSSKSAQENQITLEYQLKNHRLYRKQPDGLKFVVPKAVRWRILQYCNDKVGHQAIEKTLERLKQAYWFPQMRKYVKQYISACVDCCYKKQRSGKNEGSLHYSEVKPVPFHRIHIDHMGPFVKSKRGNCYILAISDAFSKFLVVKAVRDTKTIHVLKTLNEMTSYFGLPSQIVSDRGTAFTSKAFESYCDNKNIQHIKTAVRTPRANGQVERANQLILSFIRTTTEEPKDWDLTLRNLQWSINSQKNSTTGFSPNQLVFDFNLRDVVQNQIIAAIHDDLETESTTTIADKHELAAINISNEQEKWKQRFDRKHAVPKTYAENDIVVIENEPASVGESRKLEPKYRGPYIIRKVLGNDRYLIEDIPGYQVTSKKFCSVYAVDKIKPWCRICPELDIDDSSDEDIEADL